MTKPSPEIIAEAKRLSKNAFDHYDYDDRSYPTFTALCDTLAELRSEQAKPKLPDEGEALLIAREVAARLCHSNETDVADQCRAGRKDHVYEVRSVVMAFDLARSGRKPKPDPLVEWLEANDSPTMRPDKLAAALREAGFVKEQQP